MTNVMIQTMDYIVFSKGTGGIQAAF